MSEIGIGAAAVVTSTVAGRIYFVFCHGEVSFEKEVGMIEVLRTCE